MAGQTGNSDIPSHLPEFPLAAHFVNGSGDDQNYLHSNRKRNVRFKDATKVYQEERFDTKEFKELLWFSKAEYSEMSKEASKVVQKVLNGEYIEDADQCVRGLEKLYHGRCHEVIDLSIVMVVNERNRLLADPGKRISISELYQKNRSLPCEDEVLSEVRQGHINAFRSFANVHRNQ